MKGWAISVAALYCMILVVLTAPVIALAFHSMSIFGIKSSYDVDFNEAAGAYLVWPYWIWLLVMLVAQAALLAVPVRFTSRRPVTRGSLLPTVLASGLMMGGMAAAAVGAVYEAVNGPPGLQDLDVRCILGVMALTWCLWSLIFYRLGREKNPLDFISRQSRTLLKGSILELLIAVPTHIVARHRNECCAGFLTFIGLAMGISVMLFSFGPAVFFLFVARWKRLHPSPVKAGKS